MGKRIATTFDGTSAFTRADEAAFDVTGNLYLSMFAKFDSVASAQCLVSKSSGAPNISFLVTLAASRILFGASGDGTNIVSSNLSSVLSAGTWYFIEARRSTTNNLVEVAVTPASQTAINAFGGGGTLSGNLANTNAPFELGRTAGASFFDGAMHSVLLMNAIPSDELRQYLFGGGAGREYWELERNDRLGVVGSWPMKEASGSQQDRSSNQLDLSRAGTGFGQEVRSFTRELDHAVYGPLRLAKELLASSPAFQDLVGAASLDDALDFIHVQSIDNEADANTRPFGVIFTDGVTLQYATGRWSAGTISVQIRADIDDATDDVEARTHFANRMGKIAEEMLEESANGGRLMLRSVTPVVPFAVSAPSETEDAYYVADFTLNYGVE